MTSGEKPVFSSFWVNSRVERAFRERIVTDWSYAVGSCRSMVMGERFSTGGELFEASIKGDAKGVAIIAALWDSQIE